MIWSSTSICIIKMINAPRYEVWGNERKGRMDGAQS
jgi:hypothetical protein